MDLQLLFNTVNNLKTLYIYIFREICLSVFFAITQYKHMNETLVPM